MRQDQGPLDALDDTRALPADQSHVTREARRAHGAKKEEMFDDPEVGVAVTHPWAPAQAALQRQDQRRTIVIAAVHGDFVAGRPAARL